MGLWIAYVGFIGWKFIEYFEDALLEKTPSNYKHLLKVGVKIFYYIVEMMMGFGVFCFILDFPFFTTFYSEETYLKRFIDFFAVYQISLFLIFRIISAHKVAGYRFLINEIRSLKLHLEADAPIHDHINSLKKSMKDETVPPDVRVYCNGLLWNIGTYLKLEEAYENGSLEKKPYEETLELFKLVISSKEIILESQIAIAEREWEGSLILRRKYIKQLKESALSKEKDLTELHSQIGE